MNKHDTAFKNLIFRDFTLVSGGILGVKLNIQRFYFSFRGDSRCLKTNGDREKNKRYLKREEIQKMYQVEM